MGRGLGASLLLMMMALALGANAAEPGYMASEEAALEHVVQGATPLIQGSPIRPLPFACNERLDGECPRYFTRDAFDDRSGFFFFAKSPNSSCQSLESPQLRSAEGRVTPEELEEAILAAERLSPFQGRQAPRSFARCSTDSRLSHAERLRATAEFYSDYARLRLAHLNAVQSLSTMQTLLGEPWALSEAHCIDPLIPQSEATCRAASRCSPDPGAFRAFADEVREQLRGRLRLEQELKTKLKDIGSDPQLTGMRTEARREGESKIKAWEAAFPYARRGSVLASTCARSGTDCENNSAAFDLALRAQLRHDRDAMIRRELPKLRKHTECLRSANGYTLGGDEKMRGCSAYSDVSKVAPPIGDLAALSFAGTDDASRLARHYLERRIPCTEEARAKRDRTETLVGTAALALAGFGAASLGATVLLATDAALTAHGLVGAAQGCREQLHEVVRTSTSTTFACPRSSDAPGATVRANYLSCALGVGLASTPIAFMGAGRALRAARGTAGARTLVTDAARLARSEQALARALSRDFSRLALTADEQRAFIATVRAFPDDTQAGLRAALRDMDGPTFRRRFGDWIRRACD